MPDVVYQATSESIGLPGRSLNVARGQHFVLASNPEDGPVTNGEAFLASISSCGVTLIEGYAQHKGITIPKMKIAIEGVRAADKLADFHHIDIAFEFIGMSQEQSNSLVDVWKAR